MLAVPLSVILPDASGEPAVGRTWMFEKTTLQRVPEPSRELNVNVIVPLEGVALVEENAKQEPEPDTLEIVAVTLPLPPPRNSNPEGAFRMNVPELGKSCETPSVTVGPVSAVHDELPLPELVSALIAVPPVAAVTVTAAKAGAALANRKSAPNESTNAIWILAVRSVRAEFILVIRNDDVHLRDLHT